MSQRTYTILVDVKPGPNLRKFMSLGSAGGGGGGGSLFSGGSDIFKKLNDIGVGQLLKLTGIGLSLGALVDLTAKSSGILQGSLKLFQTSFMLILKPFGDFLGMLLRPIAVLFLQMVIPMFKALDPTLRKAGSIIGNDLAAILRDPAGLIATALGIGTAGIVAAFEASTKIKGWFDNIAGALSGKGPGAGGTGGAASCLEICSKSTTAIGKATGDSVFGQIRQFLPTAAAVGAGAAAGAAISGFGPGGIIPSKPATSTTSAMLTDTGLIGNRTSAMFTRPSMTQIGTQGGSFGPGGDIISNIQQSTTNLANALHPVPGNVSDVFGTLVKNIESNLASVPAEIHLAISVAINAIKSAAGTIASTSPGFGPGGIIRPGGIGINAAEAVLSSTIQTQT